MMCPSCDSFDSRVIDSRQDIDRNMVKRKRQCIACGEKWTTVEIEEVMYTEPSIIESNPILHNVKNILEKQTKKGIKKYGAAVNKDDYTFNGWLEHLQQELVDALVYSEALKQKGKCRMEGKQ